MEGYINFNNGNFDPSTLASQTSSVIMCAVLLDISPSIYSYEAAMNTATQDVFMQELKNSHRAQDIVVMGVTFNEKVTFLSGFQPIKSLKDDYLVVNASGRGTALYSAVNQTLKNISKYREDLELQGIDVKTNIFIITDGADNQSLNSDVKEINQFITDLKKNEAWATTFTFTMYGVGNESTFRNSCTEMGLDTSKVLTTIGADPKEIRNMMGVVSKSISSSSNATSVNF